TLCSSNCEPSRRSKHRRHQRCSRAAALISVMAARASSSARSFKSFPACPRTQCQWTLCRDHAAYKSCHRYTLLTGLRSAVLQPLRFQFLIQVVIPLRRYSLSVCTSTVQGRLSDSSAMIAAVSSMRLLVVFGSPPFSSFLCPPHSRITPH